MPRSEVPVFKIAVRRMLRALDGYEGAEKRRQQARPGDPESFVEAGAWADMWYMGFKGWRRRVKEMLDA